MMVLADLEQWMIDQIVKTLEDRLDYYTKAQTDNRLTAEMKQMFLAHMPKIEDDLEYWRSFKLEHTDVSA